jgi:hypothetical protein
MQLCGYTAVAICICAKEHWPSGMINDEEDQDRALPCLMRGNDFLRIIQNSVRSERGTSLLSPQERNIFPENLSFSERHEPQRIERVLKSQSRKRPVYLVRSYVRSCLTFYARFRVNGGTVVSLRGNDRFEVEMRMSQTFEKQSLKDILDTREREREREKE